MHRKDGKTILTLKSYSRDEGDFTSDGNGPTVSWAVTGTCVRLIVLYGALGRLATGWRVQQLHRWKEHTNEG